MCSFDVMLTAVFFDVQLSLVLICPKNRKDWGFFRFFRLDVEKDGLAGSPLQVWGILIPVTLKDSQMSRAVSTHAVNISRILSNVGTSADSKTETTRCLEVYFLHVYQHSSLYSSICFSINNDFYPLFIA